MTSKRRSRVKELIVAITILLPLLVFPRFSLAVTAARPSQIARPPSSTRLQAALSDLVPNPRAYAQAKALAALHAGLGNKPVTAAAASTPSSALKFNGIFDPSVAPPDTTNAVSPSRFVELVNSVFGIYDRSGNVISSGPISDLVGETGFLSDPQIFWDPATSRFYYAIFENRDSTSTGPDEGIAWGFSKDGTPDNTSDWCNYFNEFTYGTTSYPDYPRLGDSADFLLIGTNRFDLTDQYISSDLAWISKPSAGTTCPAASSFQTGIKSNLKNADGSQVFTPVPARQIDSKSTGWVVGTPPASLNPNYLTIYRVTRSPATGAAVIGAPKTLPVAAYSVPPDAPQGGVTTSGDPAPPLNTLSGKLTQAFSGTDPRFSHTEIWTAHTVAGGAGSVVRWYEIDPNGLNLDQSGTVASKSLYVFNGTVAPDRLVRGAKAKFGRNLVVGFNTSSQSTFSGIRMVSKLGSNPQSSKVLLKQSSGPNLDSTCFNPNRYGCRWGDYSGASPDPGAALTATSGRVWLSNQWNLASIDDSSVDWRTLNWSATP